MLTATIIDYKARGALEGYSKTTQDGLFVILVCLGGTRRQWVVSLYWNGHREWVNGHYYSDYASANDKFCHMTRERNKTND